MKHVPVLREDVQKYLDLKKGDTVIDATLGLGGHAKDILKAIGKEGKLIAFEQDDRNLSLAKENLKDSEQNVVYIYDNFRCLKDRITGEKISRVDKIFFDLGLSSPHVDEPERGFSFLKDGPLDMRFDSRNTLTAEIVVNTYPERELQQIFSEYGEERMSKKIAWKIAERRKVQKFSSTIGLASFIESLVPRKYLKKNTHPATNVFQALRIEVNDELNALKEALKGAMEVLSVGGRIVIISYHSLEDRIVKKYFQSLLKPEPKTEEEKLYSLHAEPIVKALTKKPVIPSEKEIAENPRSRSAKLRSYEKIKNL